MQMQAVQEFTPSILFVDDDLMVLRMAATLLSRRGVNVRTCTTGDEMFALCSRCSFDAVFLDVNLGSENGFALMKELVVDHCGLKVVLITGMQIKPDHRHRAIEMGAFDLIGKDSPFSRIESMISGLMNRPCDETDGAP